MKPIRTRNLVRHCAVIPAAAALLALPHPAAADPALRHVVLSSGGVGQFEFEAEADGAAALMLDVPLDQVDDVLKSLVVEDPAGPMLSVRLPGQRPLSESFRTLPFKMEALASAEALLKGLIGEKILIPASGVSGAILAVAEFEQPGLAGQASVTRHRITVATRDGIATAVLEDTPDITFDSEVLRGQIATALSAAAAQRVQDRRTLVLSLRPGGPRHVRFGYVVPVPVWKTSYRLTLPAKGNDGPAHLQAFAVVENLSGRDWRNIGVTLTSGQPVLFHTPLYDSVFATRPEAPVDVQGTPAPPVDALAEQDEMKTGGRPPAPPIPPPPPPEGPVAPAPASQNDARAPEPMQSSRFGSFAKAAPAMPPSEVSQSVAKVEFHLAAPVTASSGQSLLLPLLDQPIPAERVALFQPASNANHPLVAIRLTNNGAGALPAGLVTLFDGAADGTGSFVGDARLPAIEPGGERLASFAVDLGVTVGTAQTSSETLVGGQAAQGTLVLTRRYREVMTYTVTTPKDAGRVVEIEQKKVLGQPLIEPTGKDVKSTPEVYRVSRTIPAGTTQAIALTTERVLGETYELRTTDPATLIAMSSGDGLSPALGQAMRHAAGLGQTVERTKAVMAALQAREAAIVADQDRVRSNLTSVPTGSALQRNYLAMLQSQENQLASLREQIDSGQQQQHAGEDALNAYLAGLKL